MRLAEDRRIRDLMMKKSGQAISFVAGELLRLSPGDRVPALSQLEAAGGFSRGTLQNAINNLEKVGAVAMERHGHMGTFLTVKDTQLLLQCRGIQFLSGTMPLPYTRSYEGLSTGLFNTLSERAQLPVDIAYMRGSERRIQAVVNGRYDFAVTSLLAAKQAMEGGMAIELLRSFGPESYLKGQALVFWDPHATGLTAGMRVGVDDASLDQKELTLSLTRDLPVELVHINYSQLITHLQRGEIDAAVWNLDNILEHYPDLNYRKLDFAQNDENTAVLVVSSQRPTIRAVLDEYLDVDAILEQRRQVLACERYPNY